MPSSDYTTDYHTGDTWQTPCALCDLLARYVVLYPPYCPRPTPTPVFTTPVRKFPFRWPHGYEPLYCRDHAYLTAGLEPPDGV